MKCPKLLLVVFCLAMAFGCRNEIAPREVVSVKLMDRVVEASCGECQFGMPGKGCDLAVRIDGKAYYVDGAKLNDHGNAHDKDGMCNCVRQAKVSGETGEGRVVVTAFELLPAQSNESEVEKSSADPDKHHH